MKPHILRMQAFGPYAGNEVIDFNELGDNRLFLIHGQTGGGKTTILDAICFALYGESSGDERKSETFRSDHASGDIETVVVLDFSIGDKMYRVYRKPRQVRPKKRGDGEVEANPEGFLYELDGEGNEQKQLADKISGVTEQVENIIGFRGDQFRQVIVLPQGQFRKLLIASSDEREAILERLFETSLYKTIEESLKEKASELRKVQKDLQDEQRIYLESKDLESTEQLAEAITAAKRELKGLKPKLESAKTTGNEATKRFLEAEGLANRFADLSDLQSQLDDLDKRNAEMQAQRVDLHAGQSAAGLADLFSALETATEKENEAEEALDANMSEAKEASETLAKAKKAKSDAMVRKPELKDLESLVGDLKKYLAALEPVQRSRREQSEAEADCEAAVGEEADAAELAKSLGRQISLNEKSIASMRESAVDPGKLAKEIAALETQVDTLAELENAKSDLKSAEVNAKGLGKDLQTAEASYKRSRTKLDGLREAWEQGAASRLAASLEDSSACPVCGSLEHPGPAEATDDIPDDSELELVSNAVDRSEEERDAAKDALTEAKRLVTGEKKAVSTLQKSLSKKETRSFNVLKSHLESRIAVQKVQEDVAEQIGELEDVVKSSKKEVFKAEKEKSNAADKSSKAKQKLAAAKAKLKEKIEAIPEEYLDEEVLTDELEKASSNLDEIAALIESTAADHLEANKDDASKMAELKAARAAHTRAKSALKQQNETWQVRRDKAGFASDGAYDDARLEKDEIEELTTELKNYDGEVDKTKTLLKQKSAEIGKKKKPDIDGLRESQDSAVAAREDLAKQVTTLEADLATLDDLHKKLSELAKKLAKAESEFGIVGRLSDIANGQNSKRLSFQRFVLSALLDDVLAAATERLYKMSSGRYRLLRQREQVDQRSKGGLDLLVEDSHTGKSRPVETLSGGESFQAALSLALGLADVVQSYSGGIRMDTMFVDEGFGSLDAESLDLAMNTLIDLQKGGRLVGVISHVAEMKSCIDVQLVVKGGPEGSSTSFRMP